jgi:hypothetical protein
VAEEGMTLDDFELGVRVMTWMLVNETAQ